MIYRLAFLLCLTACASDYPSPYAPDAKRAEGTGSLGAWAPPLVKAASTDSVAGYYASLRPFPADKKPVIKRPDGLLDAQGVAQREADLTAQRKNAQKQ
jgi:hypothetical protein